jgi:hypothetical protein
MIRWILLALAAAVPLGAQTGQIVVSVTDISGLAVSGAVVRINARPLRNVLVPFGTSQKTGADGKASVGNVPSGPYEVCAQLPGSQFLDSCSWENRPFGTFLQAGATANVAIVLKLGTRITIQVNDSGDLLSQEAFPGHKLRMEMSVKGSHPIPMVVGKTAGPRIFSIVAPADSDLRLQVRSGTFQVADTSGMRMDMKNVDSFIPMHSAPAVAQGTNVTAASPTLTLQLVGVQ